MQAKDELPISHVGGLPIGALTKAEWAEYMMRHCLETRHDAERIPIVGFSVNGQVLARYARDPSYAKLIETADNLDADGQPLVFASRCLLRHPLPERVATTDFFHTAAAYAEKCGVRFFLLGANEKNIATAIAAIRERYPRLSIAGYRNGYFNRNEEAAVIKAIVAAGTDVLWVGLGTPLQEEFAIRNKVALKGVGWVKTCGGLFDYFSPEIKRAPKWVQSIGLEWLFRTIQEPRKYFWRYLATNPIALYLLLTKTRGRGCPRQ